MRSELRARGNLSIQPIVSVLITTYQSVSSLPMALASLVCQTMPRWEAVVVDDASTDATPAWLASLTDPRIRVVRLDLNQGRGAALQRALQKATGRFVCVLDADDWFYPEKLATQLRYFEDHPELAVVHSALAVFDRQDRPVG
ncbi:MAG: glycosyltransferase family 2 protein, partial [Candidatus Eremiobacteraeota bacterium]|nr:glycosyltransferase family 2 protein [Candidatus Eremiobacteraeota bacterium]